MAEVDYGLLARQVEALAEGEGHWLPLLANTAALLWDALPDINWVGFYLHACNGPTDELVLGPFQGRIACAHIALGAGVCGTAAARDVTQLVPNVHEFPGHIACDSASSAEVVVPLHDAHGQVAAVLDLDSPTRGRFDEENAQGLELVGHAIERAVDLAGPALA